MKNDYMSLYIKHQIIEGVFNNNNLFHIPVLSMSIKILEITTSLSLQP